MVFFRDPGGGAAGSSHDQHPGGHLPVIPVHRHVQEHPGGEPELLDHVILRRLAGNDEGERFPVDASILALQPAAAFRVKGDRAPRKEKDEGEGEEPPTGQGPSPPTHSSKPGRSGSGTRPETCRGTAGRLRWPPSGPVRGRGRTRDPPASPAGLPWFPSDPRRPSRRPRASSSKQTTAGKGRRARNQCSSPRIGSNPPRSGEQPLMTQAMIFRTSRYRPAHSSEQIGTKFPMFSSMKRSPGSIKCTTPPIRRGRRQRPWPSRAAEPCKRTSFRWAERGFHDMDIPFPFGQFDGILCLDKAIGVLFNARILIDTGSGNGQVAAPPDAGASNANIGRSIGFS